MAEPLDSAITWQTVSDVAVRLYHDTFLQQTWAGKLAEKTNRVFAPSKTPLYGDGKFFKIKRGPTDNVRPSLDLTSTFEPALVFDPAEIKIRVNERSPSANDMTRLGVSMRVSEFDIKKVSSGGQIVDLVEEMMKDTREGWDFKLAAMRHLPRTGLIGTVASTPVNSNAKTFAASSAYTTGSTSCNIQVASGSIALFQNNWRFDIYNSTTGALVASNMRVVDTDTSEIGGTALSQGTVALAVTAKSNVTNCNAIASGHSIYFAGGKDKNIYSIGAWYGTPSSGDSFIGGVDRTLAGNRYLLPINSIAAATARRIAMTDFDAVADAMGYVSGETGVVSLLDPRMVSSLRQDAGNDVMFVQSPTEPLGERQYNFGGMGIRFEHPTVGKVTLVGDPLAAPNTVRNLVPEDWSCQYYGNGGLEWVNGPGGMFYRMEGAEPGSGKGLIYQADGFAVLCDFCMYPRRQSQITNVRSS